MARQQTMSSSRALFAVFIAPYAVIRPSPATVLRPWTHSSRERPRLVPRTTARHISRFANPTKPTEKAITPFNDPAHPLDENIQAKKVDYVDAEGAMHRDQPLRDILRKIDRRTQHVRAVDQRGRTPIVKIYTRSELLEAQTIDIISKKRKSAHATKKEVELGWGIDRLNDLKYRLKNIESWLQGGRDVDVLITTKRDGRSVDQKECQSLLDELRSTVDDVPGAYIASTSGAPGTRMQLYMKAPIAGDKDESTREALYRQRRAKRAEKETAKAEWKAELEARAQRKAARDRQIQMERSQTASAAGP